MAGSSGAEFALSQNRAPTVTDLVRNHGRKFADRLAFRFEGRSTTFAGLAAIVERTAAALQAEGVVAGTRLAYLGKNCDIYFFLLFAAARLGAVMVPIGWRLAPAEVEYIVGDTQARLLFADETFVEFARSLASRFVCLKQIVCVAPSSSGECFFDWVARKGETRAPGEEGPTKSFIQLYTSGTTGRPKGVMLNATNFFAMRLNCAAAGVEWDRWNGDDIALIAMPVSHVGGSGYGLMTLFHGATGVIKREFSPEIVLRAIQTEAISKLFIVPTALQIVVRHPEARATDYSRIRHILYGASPMPLPLLREAMEVTGAGLVQQYGMTETAGAIVALGSEDHDVAGNARMKSAGRALPGVELRIADQEGRPLEVGQVGEILTRSGANMVGYWNLPEATAKTVDRDGWLHTGDAGHLDVDGYLYISDRVKDMICSGGENVYPAEVEAVLYEHPAIAEVSVIGVPDDTWGEAVKALVVARTGQRFVAAEVTAWARHRLAGFKLPKSWDVVDALPRTATGKVMKQKLRERYWAGKERQVN